MLSAVAQCGWASCQSHSSVVGKVTASQGPQLHAALHHHVRCAVLCCVTQGDPYKTLFVSRLSYEVTERKLRHEFEEYGPIKRIRLVHSLDTGGVKEGVTVAESVQQTAWRVMERQRAQGCHVVLSLDTDGVKSRAMVFTCAWFDRLVDTLLPKTRTPIAGAC